MARLEVTGQGCAGSGEVQSDDQGEDESLPTCWGLAGFLRASHVDRLSMPVSLSFPFGFIFTHGS